MTEHESPETATYHLSHPEAMPDCVGAGAPPELRLVDDAVPVE
jgi:hypothetical protein